MWSKPLTRRGEEDGFHREIKSSEPLDEKTELYPVDPLCSRGLRSTTTRKELSFDFVTYPRFQRGTRCFDLTLFPLFLLLP